MARGSTDKITELRAMLERIDDAHDRAAVTALILELQTQQAEAASKPGQLSG